MPSMRNQWKRRRATWAAFFVIALSISATVVLPTVGAAETSKEQDVDRSSSTNGYDQSEEASHAYAEALQTLQTLSPPPLHQNTIPPYSTPTSFLSSLFPNTQGPIASAIRIVYKLKNLVKFRFGWSEDTAGGGGWNFFGLGDAKRDGKVLKVIDLLRHSIELGNVEAIYTLAQISLFPPPYFPLNPYRGLLYYYEHASLTGNATSQSMVAFFYATGYGNVVPINQAKALLYYTFAAQAGDPSSELVLGYRHWAGIGVNEDCMTALEWYEAAAERSMAYFLSGPPGGRTLPRTATRLSDFEGGVYGPGSSVASTGVNANRAVIRAGNAKKAGETWEDLLEFYQFHADRDEIEYAYRLGKIFYQGSLYPSSGGIASGAEGVGSLPRDYFRSRQYFIKVARHVWPPTKDAPPSSQSHLTKKEGVDENTVLTASAAAAYIGRMFLRGEGVKKDARVAKMWFERGAEFGERECHNGLGIIWRDGLVDGIKDEKLANGYFGAAAGQDLAEAQVNLGKYHYQRGELALASTYFETAVRHGSPFEAYYYLALTHAAQAQNPTSPASVVTGSCGVAVSFYKVVAERGSWKIDLLQEADALWNGGSGSEKDKEGAKIRWWISAERGLEVAQNNLAYVLDQDRSSFRRFLPPASNQTARLALTQWTRSAAQRNIDALVKVGDYYYHGLGVSDEPESLRYEKAAGYYLSAVDSQMSALAMWNLGWMYENGIGVVKDFHMAKRYYDMALATNNEAYVPVLISLTKLYARSLWHTLSGGREKSLTLWADDSDEDHWYLGKAKEEFRKRWRGRKSDQRSELSSGSGTGDADKAQYQRVSDDEDPVQWAKDRRQDEIDRARVDDEGGYVPGDYFAGDYGGGPRRGIEEEEDLVGEFWETVFLLGLCAIISGLIYLRGRWTAAAARRREEENAGGQPPPPPPRDPNLPPDIGLLPQHQADIIDAM